MKDISRGILILLAACWVAIVLGLPLYCAYDQFGSWWKAIGLMVACASGVSGFIAGGVYLQRKAGW